MEFMGMRIEYSKLQRRWFVQDYDHELGWHDIGPSHATQRKAMDWIAHF